MMSVMAERYSFMNLTSSAGVIFSEIDEKPAKSEKKNGDVASFAAQFRQFVGRQHLVDHLRRQIKREAPAQQSFALVGNDEAVCDDRSHCSQAGKKRLA